MTTALTPYDLYKPDVLTGLIELRMQQDATYDVGFIAPLVQTRTSSVEMRITEGTLSRVGQFRALNANTPLSKGRFKSSTQQIDLVTLSEKEVIKEDLYIKLRSVDQGIAALAANEIVNIGVRLQRQNINLSRYMVWKAIQDALTITYPNGEAFNIDYDLDNTDAGMSASHKISSVTTAWSDPTASIIDDIDAWRELIITDLGDEPDTLIVSRKLLRYMQLNDEIQALFGTSADPRRPTQISQIADIIGVPNLVQYDSVYKDSSDVTQRFFPENRIAYVKKQPSGQPAVQLLDGPVVLYNGADQDLTVANNPGMRAEVWTTADPPVRNIRVSTSRMPLVIREALVVADVY